MTLYKGMQIRGDFLPSGTFRGGISWIDEWSRLRGGVLHTASVPRREPCCDTGLRAGAQEKNSPIRRLSFVEP